jgi:hypothetical protein
MNYFILDYIRAPKGQSGEPYKSPYSLDKACKVCGTGAILEGNLKTVGLAKVKKDFFVTLDDDYIISEKLYTSLIKDEIKIVELKKIVDYKNHELPFYHLYTNYIFPPASRKNGLEIEGQCPACKKNGYFNKVIIGDVGVPTIVFPYDIGYESIDRDFLEQSDFFFTWECTGLSNLKAHDNYVVRYARPLLIVSDKFKLILEKYKIKGLKFEEIFIDKLV